MSDLKEYERVKYIDTYVHHDHKIGVLIEYICDTTIPAQEKSFREHVRKTAMLVASADPSTVKVLLELNSIDNPNKRISELIMDLMERFKENIEITRFLRWDTEIKPLYVEEPDPPPETPAAALRVVK